MEIIMILAALAAFFGFAMARAADQGDRLPGPGQLAEVPEMERLVNMPGVEKPVNMSEMERSVNVPADKNKRQPGDGCRKEGV